jgi:hypothetical protein
MLSESSGGAPTSNELAIASNKEHSSKGSQLVASINS